MSNMFNKQNQKKYDNYCLMCFAMGDDDMLNILQRKLPFSGMKFIFWDTFYQVYSQGPISSIVLAVDSLPNQYQTMAEANTWPQW